MNKNFARVPGKNYREDTDVIQHGCSECATLCLQSKANPEMELEKNTGHSIAKILLTALNCSWSLKGIHRVEELPIKYYCLCNKKEKLGAGLLGSAM